MKKFITSLLISCSFLTVAQDTDNNLVPNPSFEETGKDRVKEKGQIELAAPWNSPTLTPADLYMEKAKDDNYLVPDNINGTEKPRTGSNYAGISFFGYRGREPRSYLQVELEDTLQAGKEYCMKFHVSMSDKAKYAVNNIAMYVSNVKVETKGNDPLSFEPQIRNIRNRVFSKQFLWEPICGIYTAKGDETHIVIGNFNTDEETAQEKIRMSRDFSGRQTYNAYYYIDDISVTPITEENREDCSCSKIAGGAMKVEKASFGTDDAIRSTAKTTVLINSDGSKASETIKKKSEISNEKEVAATKENAPKKAKVFSPNDVVLSFQLKSPELSADTKEKLNKIADYLKKNKNVKVEVQGHADVSEDAVPFLGKRRAFEVVKYLTDQGISRDQIPYKSFETELPVGSAEENARVTFSVL